MSLKKYRKLLDRQLVTRNYIKNELAGLTKKSDKYSKLVQDKEKAYLFVEQVAIETQKQLSFNINDMVASGLNSVFDTEYGFDTNFQIKRGRPECTLSFKKNDELIDPLEFSGLGAADVAAFSLRGASLSMADRYRRVLLLDEPFQRLKGEKENKRVIDLMWAISRKLHIQIICVNDERADRGDIIEGADKVFYVDQIGIKSKVTVLKGE